MSQGMGRRIALAAALIVGASLGAYTGASHAAEALPYYAGPKPVEGQDLSGMWRASSYSPRFLPIGGGEPPFTADGKARFAKNKALIGTEDGKNNCLPLGTPRSYLTAFPIMILQAPNLITIAHEQNRTFRQIRVGAELKHYDPNDWDPSYVGEAIGHFEPDNSFVVDTTNFNAMTWLDDAGTPTSDKLHVVDRWKLIDHGQKLEVTFTIDDPKIFTHPWQARRVFEKHPELELADDWVCGAPHRSLTGIKGAEKLYLPTKVAQREGLK